MQAAELEALPPFVESGFVDVERQRQVVSARSRKPTVPFRIRLITCHEAIRHSGVVVARSTSSVCCGERCVNVDCDLTDLLFATCGGEEEDDDDDDQQLRHKKNMNNNQNDRRRRGATTTTTEEEEGRMEVEDDDDTR